LEESVAEVSPSRRLVRALRRGLPRILRGQPVALAYLYGSSVTGQTTPFSDVDIALVTNAGLSPLERLKLILRLQTDLADVCDMRNADVRIIDDAPLIFRGRVVCEGILVFARDESERVAFETSTRMRYFDYLPVHQELQDAFFADLRERGLYG
jgi:predicted nucleotidyltransferase